tara:strand:+ start:547 stop:756 length:210 start_codon:yes stop_codon:yes gene_type:complete
MIIYKRFLMGGLKAISMARLTSETDGRGISCGCLVEVFFALLAGITAGEQAVQHWFFESCPNRPLSSTS